MIRSRYLRKKVMERDQGICCLCGKYDPKWEADHTVALWSGGKDALDNMRTLCRRCHGEKTVSETPVRAKTDRLRARHDLTQRRRQIQRTA